eukprot:RCo042318
MVRKWKWSLSVSVLHQARIFLPAQHHGASRFSVLTQYFQCCIVIWFVGDFINQFGVQHFICFIQYHHGTGSQAGQNTISDIHTISLFKFGTTQSRQRDDVIQTFRTAETRLSKWQIRRNTQYYGVIQLAGRFIEVADGRCAYRGIYAWENVQYFTFASERG